MVLAAFADLFIVFFCGHSKVFAFDSLLSPKGVNYDMKVIVLPFLFVFFNIVVYVVLTFVKLFFYSFFLCCVNQLHVMGGWDINSVDPCFWNLVAWLLD